MSKLKWKMLNGVMYPVCPCCGAYPLIFYGRVEQLGYLFLCNRCRIAVRRKTHPNTLAKKAMDRWSR